MQLVLRKMEPLLQREIIVEDNVIQKIGRI